MASTGNFLARGSAGTGASAGSGCVGGKGAAEAARAAAGWLGGRGQAKVAGWAVGWAWGAAGGASGPVGAASRSASRAASWPSAPVLSPAVIRLVCTVLVFVIYGLVSEFVMTWSGNPIPPKGQGGLLTPFAFIEVEVAVLSSWLQVVKSRVSSLSVPIAEVVTSVAGAVVAGGAAQAVY